MSVAVEDGIILLRGRCEAADAEALLGLLLEEPQRQVDLSAATDIHTALWQLLMALRPVVRGMPQNSFATQWLLPRIMGSG